MPTIVLHRVPDRPLHLGLLASRVGEDVHRPQAQVVPAEVEQPLDEDPVALPGRGQTGVPRPVDVDGPGYAGLASTRQRDRILVERLLDLGWHHLRLWAVDIFADPARQEAQVQRAVRHAMEDDGRHE